MAVEIILPRVDMAMESGSVARWAVKNGDSVKAGDLVFEMNTDKSVMEVEAPSAGIISGIAVDEGVEMPVGAVLAYILAPGEAEVTLKPKPATLAVKATADSKPEGRSTALSDGGFKGDEDGIRATPLARRLAREAGLDLAAVAGTGPRGRIDSDDVQKALTARQSQGSISADGTLKIRHWAAEGQPRGTMVLVHGFGGNGATWEVIGGDLAKRGFNVYAPDLAGHGRTALEADSFETLVASLEACLSTLPGGPLHLVGHSMGAAVAVRAARRMPHKIARLTLLAPYGLGTQIDEGFIRGLAHTTTSENVAALLRLLTVRTIAYSPRQLEIMTSEVSQGRLIGLSKLLVANGQQSVTILDDLAALSCPVDVIFGVMDRIIPWQHVAHLPPTIPVRLLREAGHMIHLDEPDVLARLLETISG